jgi:ABC-type transporter Mla subunit MlaD
MSPQDLMWLAIGLSCLAVAGGLLFVLIRLGGLIDRASGTLGKVDAELTTLIKPVNKTLNHVSGIAGNAEKVSDRVERVAGLAESSAAALAKTADAAQAAVSPTVATIAGIVAGVTQGAKTFFGGNRRGNGRP